MSATVRINEDTAFVLDDGRLVALDEAECIDEEANEERRAIRLGEDESWQLVPEFVREHDAVLFNTTTNYVLEKVKEWLEIKANNEEDWKKKGAWRDITKDIDESALLERLISGQEALPKAPPKSYDHPWYELADNGEDVCIDVWFSYSNWTVKGPFNDKVRIDSNDWKVVDKLGDDHYLVVWPEDESTLYTLTKLTEEDKNGLLHPRMRRLSDGKDKYSWKLTRMEKVEEDGD